MHDNNIYSDGSATWSIDSIKQEARDGSPRLLPIDRIKEAETVDWLLDCIDRVVRADPAEPVIIGPDDQLLYGAHLIARARLDGHDAISVVKLAFMPEPLTAVENRRARP